MEKKQSVGLLWDSVSNNTGDKAIGLVMRRFCQTRGIDFEVLDPFSYDPTRYSTIIVEGGELIRKRGDPFYDCFRPEGTHILNAAGLFEPDNFSYLRDYSLVTVRSEAEKRLLQGALPNVKVSPCVAALLGEFYPRESRPARRSVPPDTKPNLGVHLHWGTLETIPDVLAGLRQINGSYHITLVPFTLYNHDFVLLEKLAGLLPDASVSVAREPVDIYYVIAGLDGMVASSLHAAIFALMQNVPVVAFPYAPKVEQHLEERGLGQWAFHSVDEMVEKVLASDFLNLDYAAVIENDKEHVHEHLEQVKSLIDHQEHGGLERAPSHSPRVDPVAQATTYYKTLMDYLGRVGDLRAQLLEAQARTDDSQHELRAIMDSTGWRLLDVLRRIRLRFAPRGSARERLWQLTLLGLRVWKEQGFSSLSSRAWRKIAGRLKKVPSRDK